MNILISLSSFGQSGFEPMNILEQNGFEIILYPYERKLAEDEVIEIASDCIGIVTGVEPLNKTVMDALPNLRCISRVGVGMDSVDLGYAKEKVITVVNTPDGPKRSVAEMTIAMTFSLLRKSPQADDYIKNNRHIFPTMPETNAISEALNKALNSEVNNNSDIEIEGLSKCTLDSCFGKIANLIL